MANFGFNAIFFIEVFAIGYTWTPAMVMFPLINLIEMMSFLAVIFKNEELNQIVIAVMAFLSVMIPCVSMSVLFGP